MPARGARIAGSNCERGVRRAARPGLYQCPHCGETLSSPSRNYACPVLAARRLVRAGEGDGIEDARQLLREIRQLSISPAIAQQFDS